MGNPLFLLIGKSGSGKTTIANFLVHRGLKSVDSYTTRPKRFKFEIGHTFITDEEYNKLENIVAYTFYNSYRYCTTKEQLDDANVYVVDVDGLRTLLRKYDSDRKIIVLYLNTNFFVRTIRMLKRGDSIKAIFNRIKTDRENWFKQIKEINNSVKHFDIIKINANQKVKYVIRQILEEISYYGE